MRLRTLPVSLAGIAWAAGVGLSQGRAEAGPILLCLIFALLAQIASNFANEYFDFRDGLDKPGREGFRRGVTEGDISPGAMLKATAATLLAACCVGLTLVAVYGKWWMYIVGVVTALCVIAYSAGPWPLSRHGLGEVAVIGFFGLVPVVLTVVLEGATVDPDVWLSAFGIGLMGANVLIVNNYRDCDDDAAVGKRTMVVIVGRKLASWFYLINGILAVELTLPEWGKLSVAPVAVILYLIAHLMLWWGLRSRQGKKLNPLLGMTAMLMFVYATAFLITALICN